MAGAVFAGVGVSLSVVGAAVGDVGVSLSVVGATFGDVGVSLFVVGAAAFGEIWPDSRGPNVAIFKTKTCLRSSTSNLGERAPVQEDEFMVGSWPDHGHPFSAGFS